MQLISNSPQDTNKIAKILTDKILNTKANKTAMVVALEGELGAGKTTLVKGIAKALGIKSHITSPTFVLLKSYPLNPIHYPLKSLIHIDAYRLKDHHDLVALGIKESLANAENIVLIEWSERVKLILPSKKIKVQIDHVGENKRMIEIK